MDKKDCLYYEETNDMGATVNWCKSDREIIDTCSWCDEYVHKDLVPVVRCKDCKYAEHWYGDKARCFLWSENGIDVFEDGYCNYGERRKTMADRLISTEALMKRINCYPGIRDAVAKELRYVPTVDAEPVVRCKDCKYGQRLTDANGLHYRVCGNPFGHGIMVENHNFCAWGERREDGSEAHEG